MGGGLAGRGVRVGRGVRDGGLSVTGVDGWLLPNLSLIFGLPSVGVAGIAGGGIFDVAEVEAPAEGAAGGDMADVGGKYERGDMAPGVATVEPMIGAPAPALPAAAAAAAEGGPFEETDGVLFSFSFRVGFLLFSMLALACRFWSLARESWLSTVCGSQISEAPPRDYQSCGDEY